VQRFLNPIVLDKARAQQGDHAIPRPDLMMPHQTPGCL
jgi:hypothetical protein